MVDPGDEAERLPGAGSCHHEDGTERRFDGEALLGKRVEIHARNLDRGPAATIARTLELPVLIPGGLRRFLHVLVEELERREGIDRKSTRLNSSHSQISYAVFCLKKKKLDASLFSALGRSNAPTCM